MSFARFKRLGVGFYLLVLLVLVASMLLPACAKAPEPTTPTAPGEGAAPTAPGAKVIKPIELSLNCHIPPIHTRWKGPISSWIAEIEKRSAAAGMPVKITAYMAEALSVQADQWDSAVTGLADMMEGTVTGKKGQKPLMEELPQLWPPDKCVKKPNWHEVFEKIPALAKEVETNHILLLEPQSNNGAGPGTCKKIINRLEDLKGLKILNSGDIAVKKYAALGVISVGIPIIDAYMSAEKGIIDGHAMDNQLLEARRLGDVYKFKVENLPITTGSLFGIFMNHNKWNSLPAGVQKVFTDVCAEYEPIFNEWWWQSQILSGKYFVENMGGTMTMLPDEDVEQAAKLWKPIGEEWITKMEGKGYPAREIAKSFLEIMEKYSVPWERWF